MLNVQIMYFTGKCVTVPRVRALIMTTSEVDVDEAEQRETGKSFATLFAEKEARERETMNERVRKPLIAASAAGCYSFGGRWWHRKRNGQACLSCLYFGMPRRKILLGWKKQRTSTSLVFLPNNSTKISPAFSLAVCTKFRSFSPPKTKPSAGLHALPWVSFCRCSTRRRNLPKWWWWNSI